MERASLRPVPLRPSGPVEPAAAIEHVSATLPRLGATDAEMLALVDLVGRTRTQLRAERGLDRDELSSALARGRKALRRASFPLPGTGWCERAERLLSDELDGELEDPGPRLLAAHLANCDRCVEHERRLWQARDQLVASFDAAHAPPPAPEPSPVADEPDPEPVELPDPEPSPPTPGESWSETDQKSPEGELAEAAAPLRLVEPVAEVPTPTTPEPADPAPVEPPAGPSPVEPEPAEPPPAADEPAAAERAVATAMPQARFSLRGIAWTALYALAVLLTLASIALTVWAISGGSGF
jgi:hypothetical protein